MNFGIENRVTRKRRGGAFWFLIPLFTLLVGMQSVPAWAQVDLQLSAIARDGSALAVRGSVDIPGITTGFETLPVTKTAAPLGAITYNTQLDGNAWNAAPLNVNILVNKTSTVDARNGAILTSINTPGTTALVFSYDIFDVDLSAINLSGAALAGGRASISLPGFTTGQQSMPATVEASTKFGQSFTTQLDGNAEGGGSFNLLYGKTTTLDATTGGIVTSVNSTIPTETKLILRYPVFTMSLAASDRAGLPLTTGSPQINIPGVTAGAISLPNSVEVRPGIVQVSPTRNAVTTGPFGISLSFNKDFVMDAVTGAVTTVTGTNKLTIKFDVYNIDLSATTMNGVALGAGRGSVSLPGFTTGQQSMPATIEGATKFGQAFTTQLDGNAEGGGTVNLIYGKTTTLDAKTGGIVSSVNSTIPTETKLIFRYPIFFLALEAKDAAGTLITDGSAKLNIAGFTAGAVALPTTVEVRGVSTQMSPTLGTTTTGPFTVVLAAGKSFTLNSTSGAVSSANGPSILTVNFNTFDLKLIGAKRTLDVVGLSNLNSVKLAQGRGSVSLTGVTTGQAPMESTVKASNQSGLAWNSQLDAVAEGSGTFNLTYGKTIVLDAKSGSVLLSQNSAIPTETILIFRYPVFDLALEGVNKAGTELLGGRTSVEISGVTTAPETMPSSREVRPVSVQVTPRLDGVASGPFTVLLASGKTFTLNAKTGSITSVNGPSKLKVEFDVFPLDLLAVDAASQPLTLGSPQLELAHLSTGFVGLPGQVEAKSGPGTVNTRLSGALFGGPHGITIAYQRDVVIDAATGGVVSDVPGSSGVSKLTVMYDVGVVAVEAINRNGVAIATPRAEVDLVGVTGGLTALPTSLLLQNNQTFAWTASLDGTPVGGAPALAVEVGFTKTIDVANGNASKVAGPTKLIFEYDVVDVLLSATDVNSTPLVQDRGEIDIAGVTGGFVGLPTSLETTPGPFVWSSKLDGVALGGPFTGNFILVGKTSTLNGQTGAVISTVDSPDPTVTAVVFQFNQVNLELAAEDLLGQAITGGRATIDIVGATSGFTAMPVSIPLFAGTITWTANLDGVLHGGPHQTLVEPDKTLYVDALTGDLISFTSTPGTAKIRFQYDRTDVDILATDGSGLPFDPLSRVGVEVIGITSGFEAPPILESLPVTQAVSYNTELDGETFGGPFVAFVLLGKTSTLNARNGDIISTVDSATPSETRLVFKFNEDPVVDLVAQDLSGNSVPGATVSIQTVTTGFLPLPNALQIEPGFYTWSAELNGNAAGGPHGVLVEQDVSKIVSVLSGAVVGTPQPTPGTTKIIFQYNFVDLQIEALENGVPLTVGRAKVDIAGVTAGQVDIPTSINIASGPQQFTTELDGDIFGGPYQAFVLVNKTSTVRAATGDVLSTVNTPGTTKLIFDYSTVQMVMTAEDLNGNALAGTAVDIPGVTTGQLALPNTALVQPNVGLTYTAYLNGQVAGGPNLVTVEADQEKKINVVSAELVSNTTTGTTQVIFQYNILDLGVSVAGSPAGGGLVEVELVNVTPGYITPPQNLLSPTGGVAWNLRVNGVQVGTTKNVFILFGKTIVVSAVSGDVLSNTTSTIPGETNLIFAYNQPPVADAGPDQTLQCFGSSMYVQLDGSGSSDADGDALTYTWTEGATVLATGDQATAEKPTVLLAVGNHTITLTVEDPSGLTSTDDVLITVGDVVLPVVAVTSHTEGEWVGKKNTHVAGTVVEAVDLASVKVNGHGSFSGVAPDFTFRGPTAALQPDGPHVVTITATDIAGNIGTAELTLNVDTTDPVVSIDTPTDAQVFDSNPALVTVTGQVSDAGSGIDSVTVNGVRATVNGGTYSADITIQGNGRPRIRVVATDNVGHTSVASLNVIIDTQAPRVTIRTPSSKAVVGQTTITVAGQASDRGRGVQSVLVRIGTEPQVAAVLGENSYSAILDFPAGATNGEYVIEAVASDGVLETTVTQGVNLDVTGNDPVVSLTVLDSQGSPISGVRVDLLKSNGSSARQRQNTDGNGDVTFLVSAGNGNGNGNNGNGNGNNGNGNGNGGGGTEYLFKVYYRGGTWTSTTPVDVDTNPMPVLYTELSVLTLKDSQTNAIEGARVDLLGENGSNTGVRADTDASGDAGFEVLPAFVHKFKVYYNGETEVVGPVTGGDDISVDTQSSELTLQTSTGGLIDDARVDLLRSNESNTGVKINTASGVAAFEVLPSFVHKFKVYYNGGTYVTADLTGGADTGVTTQSSVLSFKSSNGSGIEGVRIDLLRDNGSNTGVRVGTGPSGEAPFEVLPGFTHTFKIYHNGGTAISDPRSGGGTSNISTVESTFTLTDSQGVPVPGARVDLLRTNRSNTGVRTVTDANGVAVFEVLTGYKHRFKVYYNGGDFTTKPVEF